MSEISKNIFSVSNDFNGILLDAYGVFWGNNQVGALPGAKEAMEKLVSQGKTVGILSNSTQRSLKEIDKLKSHGIEKDRHFNFLLTSGEVAANVFAENKLSFETGNKKFFLVLGNHPTFSSHKAIFEGTGYNEVSNVDEADFLYVSVPHLNGEDQTDPNVFLDYVEKLIPKKLPMVCVNPDCFACEGKSLRQVVRQGSIAKIYREMGGEVFYVGKPYKVAYEFAMNEFQKVGIKDPERILMVGDTPETDIRGANGVNMKSALITGNGIMADRIKQNREKAFNELIGVDIPDYFINTL